MKRRYWITLWAILLGAMTYTAATHRTVYRELRDATGSFRAVVSYRSYLSLLPMAPGSSSDKPGYVQIFDSRGKDYGEIPVPMLQLAEVQWLPGNTPLPGGAEIRLIGGWDFTQRKCWYWSRNQSEWISVRP